MTEGFILNQSKGFLELIGDQQDAAALVTAPTCGEYIAQSQLT